MQHFFTFLAPRNLNRKTLELFFSLNQRLSIRPFGRRELPNWQKTKGRYVCCSVCLECYHSWGISRLYTWSTSLPSFYKRYCTRHWIIYTRLFADDTSLYIIVEDPIVAAELLNADIEKIAEWALKLLVKLNPLKLNLF